MRKHPYSRRAFRILTLTVLFSLCCARSQPAFAQNTPPEDKPEGIHGIVVNSVTHEPIGRALVYSPDNRFATMTDSEGRFEFTFSAETDQNKGSESGSVDKLSHRGQRFRTERLAVRKPGFLPGESAAVNLSPDASAKELTISLTPEALVVGRVVLPTSEASDTIQLELYRRQVQEGLAHWILTGSAATKSNGEFRFADLPEGSYKLLTRELLDRDPLTFDPGGQLYGYPPIYFPNANNFAAAQTIQLIAGQTFQADISLVRHAYYPIKVDIAGVPDGVHGFSIVVSPQGQKSPGFALGYNTRSQTIEGLLPDGNYTLEALSFAPNGASGFLNITVRGAPVEGPRMILVSNGSIKVNVKEEFTSNEQTGSRAIEGQPVGVHQRGPRRYINNVRLEPADDFVQRGTGGLGRPSGPEDESLVIQGAQPGRYWVKVDTTLGFVASISSGATDLQHHPLIVGPGGSSSPIEITMRDDAAEIDGTIEGLPASPTGSPRGAGDGAPSAFLYFIPLPESSGEFRDIWVQPDGKFGPQEMPPGTYRVLAFDHRQADLEYRNPEAMKAYDAKGQLVRLVAGQKEHLHLQLISANE